MTVPAASLVECSATHHTALSNTHTSR
jgi:hypothetical protein